MNHSKLSYSVGALLYCPANNPTLAESIIQNKFGNKFSLALCLEDTIRDDRVAEAEHTLKETLGRLYRQTKISSFYLPKIFIRVRSPRQIFRLYKECNDCGELITGFILPKFSMGNAEEYIAEIIRVNEFSQKTVYAMPIYESPDIINLKNRYDILYALKDSIDAIEELILNIRVGGNDLCHMFGFRRHDNESIHQIRPVADIFSDIMTVYGMDYVVSGPVWEYYNSPGWETGMRREIAEDKLLGFVGKTVIYPNQIEVVNDSYQVAKEDYEDALAILNWDKEHPSLVSASVGKKRMNERKTHENWAIRTLRLAESFGVRS